MYSVGDIKAVDTDTSQNLRVLLCQRGVYFPKGENVQVAENCIKLSKANYGGLETTQITRLKPSFSEIPQSQEGTAREKKPVLKVADDEPDIIHVEMAGPEGETASPAAVTTSTRRADMAHFFKAYSKDGDSTMSQPRIILNAKSCCFWNAGISRIYPKRIDIVYFQLCCLAALVNFILN